MTSLAQYGAHDRRVVRPAPTSPHRSAREMAEDCHTTEARAEWKQAQALRHSPDGYK